MIKRLGKLHYIIRTATGTCKLHIDRLRGGSDQTFQPQEEIFPIDQPAPPIEVPAVKVPAPEVPAAEVPAPEVPERNARYPTRERIPTTLYPAAERRK